MILELIVKKLLIIQIFVVLRQKVSQKGKVIMESFLVEVVMEKQWSQIKLKELGAVFVGM